MDYQTASEKIVGRCARGRKLESNTYLEHRSFDEIAVRLHSTDVITFHPDGRVVLNTGGWTTVTTKDRMNRYMPSGWRVWSERGRWLVGRNGAYSNPLRAFEDGMTLHPNGEVTGGGSVAEWREGLRKSDNARNRVRNRARYWLRNARERKPAKGLTVQKILAEQNATVRVAKMTVYGIERFLLESGAEVIHEQAGYQLISLELDRRRHLRALKMTCPSTGVVYLNTVLPNIQTVSGALDWMFETPNYLERLTQEA